MTIEEQNGGQASPDAQGVTPTVAAPATPPPDAAGDKTGAAEDVKSLPEWAQRELRELRKENAGRRKAEQEAETQRKQAEEQRLADEKQWQQLATQRGDEVAALKVKADAYDALQARLLAQVKAEVAKWPDEVKGMAPDGEDAAAWLAWAEKARPLAGKLNGAAPVAGNPGNPPAQGKAAAVSEAVKAENARFVGTRF